MHFLTTLQSSLNSFSVIDSGGISTTNNLVSVLTNGIWNLMGGGLNVGSAGTGNVLVINGGVVTNGSASIFIGTGNSGAAFNTLTISNGGKLFSTGAVVMGLGANSNVAAITGNNALWNVGGANLTVLYSCKSAKAIRACGVKQSPRPAKRHCPS